MSLLNKYSPYIIQSPWRFGIALFLAIAVPSVLIHGFVNDWVFIDLDAEGSDPYFRGGWWGALVTALLISYVVTMRTSSGAQTLRDSAEANRLLGLPDFQSMEKEALKGATHWLRIATALGVIMTLYVVFFMIPATWDVLRLERFDPEPFFYLIFMTPLLVFILRSAVTDIFNVFMFQKEAVIHEHLTNIVQVDALKPLATASLRSATGWLFVGAIVLLYPINDASYNPWAMAPFIILVWAQGLTMVIVPRRWVKREVKTFRDMELARLQPLISECYDRTLTDVRDMEAFEQLSALMTYRDQVEGLSDKAFDMPNLIRFILFMIIPLGSWFGGAMVERLVDAFIG